MAENSLLMFVTRMKFAWSTDGYLWNHEDVFGGLRIDVMESHHMLVLKDDIYGNGPANDSGKHRFFWLGMFDLVRSMGITICSFLLC